MSHIVFICAVCGCQVSTSRDLHLDIIGATLLGSRWGGQRTRAQKLVPVRPQSGWGFSKSGAWTAPYSCCQTRNAALGTRPPSLPAPSPGGPSRRRAGGGSPILPLTVAPGVSVAVCPNEVPVKAVLSPGLAKNAVVLQTGDGFCLALGGLSWEAKHAWV